MRIRFQADADLDEDIVTGLRRREPSRDFQTGSEARLEALHDREVLARAASQGRILVSHDRKTMPRHFAEFILKDTSPGAVDCLSENSDRRRDRRAALDLERFRGGRVDQPDRCPTALMGSSAAIVE